MQTVEFNIGGRLGQGAKLFRLDLTVGTSDEHASGNVALNAAVVRAAEHGDELILHVHEVAFLLAQTWLMRAHQFL